MKQQSHTMVMCCYTAFEHGNDDKNGRPTTEKKKEKEQIAKFIT
jgi:hypothetical protein